MFEIEDWNVKLGVDQGPFESPVGPMDHDKGLPNTWNYITSHVTIIYLANHMPRSLIDLLPK